MSELARIRESFCEHFVRTGKIDQALRSELEYLTRKKRGLEAPAQRLDRSLRKCKAVGCAEKHYALGLCKNHWQLDRLRRLKNARAV